MSQMQIAKRYAKALQVLTRQKGNHKQALAEISAVAGVFAQNSEIAEYFKNPLISPDQKRAALEKALEGLQLSDEVKNTLKLLAEKHRLGLIQALAQSFQECLDEEEGVTRGIVRSAKPLSPEALRDLESRLGQTIKKKIVLTFQEDSRVLGGVVAQVGGWTFDDSLESHLKRMTEDLNRSAN